MARSLTPNLDKAKQPKKMPPRARELVELMYLGAPDGSRPPMSLEEAASDMGIARKTALIYFAHPLARQYAAQLLQQMRDGQRGKNLQRLCEIRDQNGNLTAAVQAIRAIEPPADVAHAQVNIGSVQITAGYVLAPPPYPRDTGRPEPAAQPIPGPPSQVGYEVLPPARPRAVE